jgi:hypothetical protein
LLAVLLEVLKDGGGVHIDYLKEFGCWWLSAETIAKIQKAQPGALG